MNDSILGCYIIYSIYISILFSVYSTGCLNVGYCFIFQLPAQRCSTYSSADIILDLNLNNNQHCSGPDIFVRSSILHFKVIQQRVGAREEKEQCRVEELLPRRMGIHKGEGGCVEGSGCTELIRGIHLLSQEGVMQKNTPDGHYEKSSHQGGGNSVAEETGNDVADKGRVVADESDNVDEGHKLLILKMKLLRVNRGSCPG